MEKEKYKNPKKHRCVGCGKLFNEEDIQYAPDPYQSDVNDNDDNVWECVGCRYESEFAQLLNHKEK